MSYKHYIAKDTFIYSNQIELIMKLNNKNDKGNIITKLSSFYKYIFIYMFSFRILKPPIKMVF